jgi:hypothetical protein
MKYKMMKNNKQGMELVQVAILIAIAVAIGLVFKAQIGEFVDDVFGNLLGSNF